MFLTVTVSSKPTLYGAEATPEDVQKYAEDVRMALECEYPEALIELQDRPARITITHAKNYIRVALLLTEVDRAWGLT